jgi:hypothetical protein
LLLYLDPVGDPERNWNQSPRRDDHSGEQRIRVSRWSHRDEQGAGVTISRRALFALLSLASLCAAVGCGYGYLVLAFKVWNENQNPKIERIAIAWLLGAAAGLCLTIGFSVAAVWSWRRS